MIKFVYFDLGKVLVDFSHEIMCEQMAVVSGTEFQAVWELMFGGGLNEMADRGQISSEQFYSKFCSNLRVQPEYKTLLNAAANIFTIKADVAELAVRIKKNGKRTGILSNTCEIHWDFVTGNFGDLLQSFDQTVLSFEVGAIKPEQAIYQYAIDMAGCLPDNVFFIDDRKENVDGAIMAGIDAVLYSNTKQLTSDLMSRDLI